ncbi:hypothetical protein, partial [Microseira wollei]|uniref:hypothetical protein n=1 Tax=Microseira wollei TaxID=467598 RepID=UPI001CFCF7A4
LVPTLCVGTHSGGSRLRLFYPLFSSSYALLSFSRSYALRGNAFRRLSPPIILFNNGIFGDRVVTASNE